MFAKFEGETREYRAIARVGELSVESRRSRGHEVSEAHNASHLRNVAELGEFVGDIYGFSEQEKKLSQACGWLHDVVRSPSEDASVADDQASAKEAVRLLEALHQRGAFATNEAERAAVRYAIERHGSFPSWLQQTDTSAPTSLGDKLWLALFVADKMEANGVRVIARRSSFVAGDRLRGAHGDWRDFGFQPDRDEALVVALESMLRLAFINPEDQYPYRLVPLVHPLYESQRAFVNGILRSLAMTVEGMSRLLLETRNREGKDILEARNIRSSFAVSDIAAAIQSHGGISNVSIRGATAEQAQSATETVTYFSRNFHRDLDELVDAWRPDGKTAQEWQRAMKEYKSGKWIERQRERYHFRRLLERHTLHDEGLMPLYMGPPHRVPDYALGMWGLTPIDEATVVNLYKAEWALGDQGQLALVSKASVEAGFGDYPELLRQEAAQEVARALADHETQERIRILEIGPGPGLSTVAIFKALPETMRQNTEFILVDPSAESRAAAEQLLREHNIRFQYVTGADIDALTAIEQESVDALVGVASIHHHSRIPFELYYRVLKPLGVAVFADWHNSLWEHPYRVKQFLDQFVWDMKQDGMEHWESVYMGSLFPAETLRNPADQRANDQITQFWNAYCRLTKADGDVGTNAIWPLEGHRPVERYVSNMRVAGFIVGEPKQLLPDSRLLMLTVGQKPL